MLATVPGVIVQFTVRSVTTVPFASFTVAANVLVLFGPVVVTESTLGVIVTLDTGTGFTVSVVEPDLPSLVAVIVAVPAATPVATPDELTVATAVLLELHVTRRPVSVPP